MTKLNEKIFKDDSHLSSKNHEWFKFINNKGEKVIIEVSFCFTDPKHKKSLPNLWLKNGYTEKLINNYITINTYVYNDFGCWGFYNPTITNDHKINFKKLLEPSEENKIKLLNEVYKLANKPFYNLEDKNFNFKEFDKLENLNNKEFNKLYKKAKKLWKNSNMPNFNFCNFETNNCFISSSDLHGFYFPNLNSSIRCIAFINKKPVLVYSV